MPTPPTPQPPEPPQTGPNTPRWAPSVTVAAVIVRQDPDGPRYLLIEEHTPEGLRLNNPAGHLERGETPQQAVVREAREETARDFAPEALLGVYLARFQRPATGEDITYVRIAYAGTAGQADPSARLDEGIVATHWLTLEEARATWQRHRSPLVLRCLEDHAAGRRLPLDAIQADPSLFAPEVKATARDIRDWHT